MEKVNETKERIIYQAIQLIKLNGFDQVTIIDICAASDISKHTFYYYFKSKEDVLMRYFHIPYALTTNRMCDIISMGSPVDQLWHILEPRIQHFNEVGPEISKRVIIINMQRDIGTFHNKEEKKAFHELECDLIAKGQELGEIRNKTDSKQLSKALHAQMVGLVFFWSMSQDFDLLSRAHSLFLTTLFVEDIQRTNESKNCK